MAEIEVIDPTRELRPGESLNLRVKVKNVSGAVWPGNGQNDDTTYRVRLGNHWLDAQGRLLTLDDGRTALPYDLRPGREVELPLTITAPKVSGDYLLEFDMVQEKVAWFADEGEGSTTRLKVTVR